jgi:hypothetical protein
MLEGKMETSTIQNGDPTALPQSYIHFIQLTAMLQDLAHGNEIIINHWKKEK